jgi:hypothetical protein
MPAISLPQAQSKASKRFMGLWAIGRVPWPPFYFCDPTYVRRPLGAKKQGCQDGPESFTPTSLASLLVILISCGTAAPDAKKYPLNHPFDFLTTPSTSAIMPRRFR